MKSIFVIAAAMTLALASSVAVAQEQPAPSEPPPPSCEGQRFVFEAGVKPHVTRVTLCSKKDATDADLVKMFESAAAALEKNTGLNPERRGDLIAQFKLKAAEYRSASVSSIAGLPSGNALAVNPPPKVTTTAEPPSEYSSLPPLPPPLPAEAAPARTASLSAAASATVPPVPSLPKPRLTIECAELDDLAGAGPCGIIQRETHVVVRADEALPAQTALRFVRRGDTRAEVELAQLSRGKSMQFALPSEVCAGVGTSKVEIEVVRRAGANTLGQVVDSMGPYLLQC